ncbi:hypothetical protein B4U80_04591 [Leptotrombidium deliense]|uniref:XK-related protein n=1 Tax=Leptotrombidium deliense TaxID=299467 RepID=A0A443SI50_9ACAR|nr:hypothetical protein B4U80_04591 [Leptotrombidium deliense]
MSSLFEISWSLASYHRALRRSVPEKRNMTKLATLVVSRVVAIALFTSEYGYWLLPFAVGHWGVMTIWVMHQGTRFCDTERGDPRPCEEYLFNMVVGAIYLICFLNVKDEPTRFKYLAYYLILFFENSILITLWYMKTSSDPLKSLFWFHAPAFATVISAFCMGIVFMLIYYRFLHPNGRPLWINRAARCC